MSSGSVSMMESNALSYLTIGVNFENYGLIEATGSLNSIGLSILGSENGYNISFDYKFETRERYMSHGLVLNGKLFF